MTGKGPWSTSQILLARVEYETAIAIEPKALVSWDDEERMGETV